MIVLDRYDVLGHTVRIQMESTSPNLREFKGGMTVDNNKTRFSNCIFGEGETVTPEKVLKETIEESLSYAKNPNLGAFIQNNNFGKNEQEINAGDMLFRAAKDSHDWMLKNFSVEEIKELYQAIDPELNLDSIGKEVFCRNNVFGSYNKNQEQYAPITTEFENEEEKEIEM